MKTTTICGSMKFADEMIKSALQSELANKEIDHAVYGSEKEYIWLVKNGFDKLLKKLFGLLLIIVSICCNILIVNSVHVM